MEKIVSYRDDPTIKVKVVTTQSGLREYRRNCKKFRGGFYIRDEECVEVDGVWYRKEGNVIVFDHTNKKWVLKSKAKNMVQGIVGFKDKNTPVFGHFTLDHANSVTMMDGRTGDVYVCNDPALAEQYCLEDLSTGVYYYNYNLSYASGFKKIMNRVDNKQKGYNIEDNVDEMELKIKTFHEYTPPISRQVSMFGKLLGDTTFGAEAEAIAGYLPPHVQHRTGVVICRDGSLHAPDGTQGPEFTTIPLKGAKGLQALITLGKELTPRTVIDKHCAYHIHLGNIPTTRIFLVALYRLAYMIQDELFTMFPYYKIDEKKYAGKEKNYCKKLSKLSVFAMKRKCSRESYEYYINDNYMRIFSFLSNGFVPGKQYNRKLGVHPKANEKWNKVARYYWVNFMNCIFSKRNTVEFRIHQGTRNPQKMVTWLFICNAIVKTAMHRTSSILRGEELTLSDVLDYYKDVHGASLYGRTMTDYLKDYVRARQEYFKNDFDRGEYVSEQELQEDAEFQHPYTLISEMFK